MPETVVHFQIRMPPVLHEQLASWAKEDKASLNALIVGILERAIAAHEAKVMSALYRGRSGLLRASTQPAPPSLPGNSSA